MKRRPPRISLEDRLTKKLELAERIRRTRERVSLMPVTVRVALRGDGKWWAELVVDGKRFAERGPYELEHEARAEAGLMTRELDRRFPGMRGEGALN